MALGELTYDWGILIEYTVLAFAILACCSGLGLLAEDYLNDETEIENGKKEESDLHR